MKLRMTRHVAVAVTAAAVFATAACGAGEDSAAQQAGTSADDPFTLVLPSEPDSLAAEQAKTSAGYAVLRNIQESLLNRDPATNELVGELATDWEQIDDLTWRFHLREGVKFHDGSDFNAEAAAFALSKMWDPNNVTILTSYLGPNMTFTPVDDLTLDVTTAQPDPILLYRLFVSPIFSKQAYESDPDSYPLVPVGTGPYKFVEWQKGQSIKLEANPDWWGTDASDAYGEVTIQHAEFVFRAESTVRAGMVTNGEAEFARWVTGEDCKAAAVCKSTPGVETIFLRPDTSNPILGDPRVRKAIAMSVNRDQILNSILGGGRPATQMVGPSAFGYDDSLEPLPYDIAAATQLIDEARADGVPVESTITIVARQAFIQRVDEIVQVIADGLRQIGLTVETSLQEQVKFEEMLRAPKPIDPDRGYLILHSHGNELMDYGLSVNSYLLCDSVVGTYCNEQVDLMFAETWQMFGEEREQALIEIAEFVAEDNATIPVGQPEFHFQLAEGVNWEPRLDGFILLKEMTLS